MPRLFLLEGGHRASIPLLQLAEGERHPVGGKEEATLKRDAYTNKRKSQNQVWDL